MGASFKMNKKEFSQEIEDYVFNFKCSYLDAILALCDRHFLEPHTVAKLISKPIKERLEVEGQEINLLPKKNPLPV